MKKLPPIALGTWSWGGGFAGGDQVFGNHLDVKSLKPVFDTAMKEGLNLWDTAAVYGMGSSESLLGEFVRQYQLMCGLVFGDGYNRKKAERESLGYKLVIYMAIFTLLAYLWKVKIWRKVH